MQHLRDIHHNAAQCPFCRPQLELDRLRLNNQAHAITELQVEVERLKAEADEDARTFKIATDRAERAEQALATITQRLRAGAQRSRVAAELLAEIAKRTETLT